MSTQSQENPLFFGGLRRRVKIVHISSESAYPVETTMLFTLETKRLLLEPFRIGAEGRTRTGTGYAHYPLKIACLPISPLRQISGGWCTLVGGLTLRGRGFYISLRHV